MKVNYEKLMKINLLFTIAYNENYQTKSEAIKREKELKKWKSRIKLEELIRNANI
jgi:predicted GIY-YIG superfamily endonuclease